MSAVLTGTSLEALLAGQRAAYRRNPYPGWRERKDHLRRLEQALLESKDEIAAALDRDFGGRSKDEVIISELFVSLSAIRHARKHVREWMRDRPRGLAWALQPGRVWVMPQPLGVVGIIAPWNYPIFLTMAPLAGALAAGNRVMIKVSEFTPATSETTAKILANAFDPDHITVVTGDAGVGRAFSSLPFDHLLFTGSTAVGRHVMRAAAENLTPVTLELGGKSPAIVAPDANLESAAADIVYGKFLNAGQTCIAPDYVLVPETSLASFLDAVTKRVQRYWPQPALNSEYTSVIDDRHLSRLCGYVDEARARGCKVIEVGPPPGSGVRRMPPTLIVNPPDDTRVMREEIFGPVLPVKTYAAIDEAIRYVNERDRPLALYLFTPSAAIQEEVLKRTVSGAVTMNDTLAHVAAEDLPFGGVGPSGMGHYHGQEGFDTFSKLKPVFRRRWPGLGRLLRPPYGPMQRFIQRILIK